MKRRDFSKHLAGAGLGFAAAGWRERKAGRWKGNTTSGCRPRRR